MSAGASIGRHFSIVTMIPASLLVFYVAALTSVGAISGPFSPGRLPAAAAEAGWPGLTWLVVLSLVLGLTLHPFGFGLIQFLEGYWGTSRLALGLAQERVQRHRQRFFDAEERAIAFEETWMKLALGERAGSFKDKADRRLAAVGAMQGRAADAAVSSYLWADALRALLSTYPHDPGRIMPTRLGNVLRRMEDAAGGQYGLRAIPIAPHLSLVADPTHYAYAAGQRQVLDLTVNLWAVGSAATVVTAVLLADDGPWVLLTIAPFIFAYAAYRGAIAAAAAYGVAVSTLIDLSRFRLYEALQLPRPTTAAQERATAALAIRMLGGSRFEQTSFTHPTASGPASQES